MDQLEFQKQQFYFLRREIEARQTRLFWTLVIGLLGLPTLTYLAKDADTMAWLVIPFFILVTNVLFIAEQHAMMRAGRFVRLEIERSGEVGPGWESWLESQPEFRLMERNFVGCFVCIFLLYYFLAVGMVIFRLVAEANLDPSGQSRYQLYGAAVAYAIGALWLIMNLVHHWRFAVSTTAKLPPSKGNG